VRKVALFGGTFDPVHLGHLTPAVRAAETFGFDALVFVPSGQPPHKLGEPLTPFAHRFAMVALATQSNDRFLISAIEAERPGPTYTFDTVRQLRELFPAQRHYFLMGSDSFAQIGTWHRWEELLDLADLVVLHRPTVWGDDLASKAPAELRPYVRIVRSPRDVPEQESAPHSIYFLEHEPFPIAASELRQRVRAGEPICEWVPPEVDRYIAKHRLYLRQGEGADGS
jgi:nicotinate-nucleotide adenylyltransferase